MAGGFESGLEAGVSWPRSERRRLAPSGLRVLRKGSGRCVWTPTENRQGRAAGVEPDHDRIHDPSTLTPVHHTSPAQLIWAHNERELLGYGECVRIDPGTGPHRYQRALDALSQLDRAFAFASFTFDPSEPGSVVLVPEEVKIGAGDAPPSAEPLPRGAVSADGTESWKRGLGDALAAIDEARVAKVVLTRQMSLEFEEDISTLEIARRLRARETVCFTFMVDGLVGASPELLVSLLDGTVASLALAGTAPNAHGLVSEKMDLEHILAAASVREGMSRYVGDLKPPTRSVLEFGDIKHLATRFEGVAIDGATVLDLLGALHPTASVAGAPTETSLELIHEIEPFSRGRYAGPVGWFNSRGEGEFALALRCGLVEGNEITLYAGGGIVTGSDLESEFAETELKLQPMLRALGLADEPIS